MTENTATDKNRKEPGALVVSTAGRDKNTVYVILETVENGAVLVADGRKRKVEKPKRKSRKHLMLLPGLTASELLSKEGTNRADGGGICGERRAFWTNRSLRTALREAKRLAKESGLEKTAFDDPNEEGLFCRKTM